MTDAVNGVAAGLLTQANPYGYEGALTPEGLMLYLSERLSGLDDQVNQIFAKQEATNAARTALNKIVSRLSELTDQADKDDVIEMPGRNDDTNDSEGAAPVEQEIVDAIRELGAIDPELANDVASQLTSEGHILRGVDGLYRPSEVRASTKYMENLITDLETEAQMGMIRLQSLMSTRQTAIQLSTNLISSLGESQKAIAANIGR